MKESSTRPACNNTDIKRNHISWYMGACAEFRLDLSYTRYIVPLRELVVTWHPSNNGIEARSSRRATVGNKGP